MTRIFLVFHVDTLQQRFNARYKLTLQFTADSRSTMGNSMGHDRHRDSTTRKMVEKMHKGLFASPAQATKQSAKDETKTHKSTSSTNKHQQKNKANPQQGGNAAKTSDSPTKKGRKKKNKRTSTEPRKGRKESFSKYMPNYVPTVPIDETLGGAYDAVEHETPTAGTTTASRSYPSTKPCPHCKTSLKTQHPIRRLRDPKL